MNLKVLRDESRTLDRQVFKRGAKLPKNSAEMKASWICLMLLPRWEGL